MKKICALLFLLLAFTFAVMAQNGHYSYGVHTINGIVNASSAVTVICPGGKAYLAQTDDQTNNIHLTEINSSTLQQTIGYGLFFLQASSKGKILLRGGFESFDGIIVLYGLCYDTLGYNYGYVAEIDVSGGGSLKYNELPSGTEITKGCSGYDINGSVTNMFVFKEGQVFTLDPMPTIPFNPMAPPSSIYYYYGLEYSGQQGYFSDVMWSRENHCFVTSGDFVDPINGTMNPFIDCFRYNSTISYPYRYDEFLKYSVNHNLHCEWSEGRSLLSLIDADNLLLYQDLRDDSYDVIWLTLISDFVSLPILSISTSFYAPLHKLSSYGMVYDSCNKQVTFLGRFNFCSKPTTFIAQTDPYDLSFLNVRQISSTAGNSSCQTWAAPFQTIYSNELEFNNIVYNPHHPCSAVISTGIAKTIFGTTPLLTETYDISMAICDFKLDVLDSPCSPSIGQIPTIPIVNNYDIGNATINQPDTTFSYIECKDPIVCSKEENSSDTGSTKGIKVQQALVTVSPNSGFFVCYGFQGNIQYQVFDIAGKLVSYGETTNGISNPLLSHRNGLYIIRCKDAYGTLVTQKVFLNR